MGSNAHSAALPSWSHRLLLLCCGSERGDDLPGIAQQDCAVTEGVGSSGHRCCSNSWAGTPPHLSSGFPNRGSQQGSPMTFGWGGEGGTVQGRLTWESEVRDAKHCLSWLSSSLSRTAGGWGGVLPRLWLDKGYSLQELTFYS